MRSAAAQVKTADNISSSKPPRNFTTEATRTKAQIAGNETELSDDFIVGALLFSLFASNRSEIVSEMLPGDE
ncbi:MAG: hypothetical protein AAB401_11775 [Acidobacteriota bacterium]